MVIVGLNVVAPLDDTTQLDPKMVDGFRLLRPKVSQMHVSATLFGALEGGTHESAVLVPTA